MDIGDKVEGDKRIGDKFCTACRTKMKLDVTNNLFCPNCGYRPNAPPPTEKVQESGNKEKPAPPWLVWVKIGGYILIGAACIYMLYAMIGMMDSI